MGKVRITWTTTERHEMELDADVWAEIEDDAENILSEYESDESFCGTEREVDEPEDVDDDE